jgi:hypothetical protein
MMIAGQIERVVRRSRAFYAASRPGHLLVSAKFPVDSPAVPPLSSFDLDRQLGEWLDLNLAAERPLWRAKAGLDDDTLPVIAPFFGIAEHSAWLGQEVLFQDDTCLPVPIIHSPDDLQRLEPDTNTRWFRYMRDGYEHLRHRQDGTFLLAVRGIMTPMDLANAVRGNEFFVDVLAEPEFAHQLLRLLTRAARWYYPQLASWASPVADGHVFLGGFWVGPSAIGHLSNDAAMLCGPDVYETYGFPYECQQVAGYRHVIYHVHNEQMHFVPRVAALPGMARLDVAVDPKTLPPIQDLPRILAATGSANLRFAISSDLLRQNIGALTDRNFYLDVRCRSREDAVEIVRLVRDHSKPLE